MEIFKRFCDAIRSSVKAPAKGGVITEDDGQDDTLIMGGIEGERWIVKNLNDPSEWKIEPEEFKAICEQIENFCFAPSEVWQDLFKTFLLSDKFVGDIEYCANLADLGLKEFSKRFNREAE